MPHLKRFAILLYEDESVWAAATDEVRQDHMARHDAFSDAVGAAGRIVSGEALSTVSTATTVRNDRGGVVTSGPFAELTEQLGGFYVVDLPDLETAVDIVRLLPAYTVEIRPVMDVEDL
ncbi:YCII-related protein [Beutenbergia cavernae DSM 12333]|uniref:YCII-related protein n=1 Tax=Beutenbergia cavernae (strain ATCC BAA-8 / DSM 12333 / CCUG 43141 / JCM 11478 / NBRC 16432 / NCIMB 13614 / HKI 0122) TaxID=471853 RepID=C5C272_BEUC1|nr:YciI family protein [Beutenbergia cavernae]ACQ81697.1 YCII-related protein [Beutenbergia cavernae DSM 12333]